MAYPFQLQPPSNDNEADFDPLEIAMGQPVVPDGGDYDAATSDYIATAYDPAPDFAVTVNGKTAKVEVLLPTGEFLGFVPKSCGCCSCSGDGPDASKCPCGMQGAEDGWCVKHEWHEVP